MPLRFKNIKPLITFPDGIISVYAQLLLAGPESTRSMKMILDTGVPLMMLPPEKILAVGLKMLYLGR